MRAGPTQHQAARARCHRREHDEPKRSLPTSFPCYSWDFGQRSVPRFLIWCTALCVLWSHQSTSFLCRLPSLCDAPFIHTKSRFSLATQEKNESKGKRIHGSLLSKLTPVRLSSRKKVRKDGSETNPVCAVVKLGCKVADRL